MTFYLLTDIDECERGPCSQKGGICKNTDGSYTCTCGTGYTGNGHNCTGNENLFLKVATV